MTPRDIEKMHSGTVLKRNGKKRLRVVKPSTYKTCYTCREDIVNMAVKWERGSGVTLSVLCPTCAVKELE